MPNCKPKYIELEVFAALKKYLLDMSNFCNLLASSNAHVHTCARVHTCSDAYVLAPSPFRLGASNWSAKSSIFSNKQFIN